MASFCRVTPSVDSFELIQGLHLPTMGITSGKGPRPCGCSPVSTDNDQLRSLRYRSLQRGLSSFVSVALGGDVIGAAVRLLNRSCDFHRLILVGRHAAGSRDPGP